MADLTPGLLERCRQLDETLSMTGSRIWFRGQADSSWPLLPTALRRDFLEAAAEWVPGHGTEAAWALPSYRPNNQRQAGLVVEQIANDRFRREAARLVDDSEDLGLVYMEARHAGLPSRLLDWTTSPLLALFFACRSESRSDGMIHILDPVRKYYYLLATSKEEFDEGINIEGVTTPVTDRHISYSGQVTRLFGIYPDTQSFAERGPETDESTGGILPILPSHRLEKVAAQRSCFTFHPDRGEEDIPEGLLLGEFEVPSDAKETTLASLRLLGVDESTVWPGPDGTAQAIRSSMGLP